MDNNDHTYNPTPPTSGADGGPEVRRMSAPIRAHARSTLLAETSRTNISGAAPMAAAHGVSFGRDGVDDAPTPLKKRWMVIAAGLAVAAAGAAIFAGSGVLSGDDLGTGPAGTDQSQDPPSPYSAALADCQMFASENQAGTVVSPLADLTLLYEHVLAGGYSALALTDGLNVTACGFLPDGTGTAVQAATGFTGTLLEEAIVPTKLELGVEYLFIGQVGTDVSSVQVYSGEEPIGYSHVENGWFSALALPVPGDNVFYLVTLSGGSTVTVPVGDLPNLGSLE